MKKLLYFFSILCILSMVFYAGIASASWNAYVISPGVKYRPWDTVPTSTTLTINAARGQWASFQIACKVSNEDVSGVDVSVTTPTSGSSSLKAPIIYKEVTYNVINKSRDDGAVGEWPDPLIPKVDQYYSEKRNAFPFKVNRVSPVYNMFDFNIASSNPVTRNNGAKIKPTISGTYSGSSPLNYHVKIDTGGSLGVATFKWSNNGGISWNQSRIKTASSVSLNNGLTITFPSQTYVLNDEWEFFANASRNEMVWVECFVPETVTPGDYNCTVTVSATGKTNQLLNITVKVSDVIIPKTSSIPVQYQGSKDSISEGHFGEFQGSTAVYQNLYKRYLESSLKHRISVSTLAPDISWNGSTIGNWTTHKDWISPYMNGTWPGGSSLSVYRFPLPNGVLFAPIVFGSSVRESNLTQSEKNYLAALDDLLTAQGWLGKAFLLLAEEPSWTGTTPPINMTNAIINGASSIHTANSNYKTLATKRYVSEWSRGPVNIWAPGIYSFGTYPRSYYDSEISAGRQIWSYLSCQSKGCNVTGDSSCNKWPSDMVDATLPNLRGYYWLMFDNDVRGDLYYGIGGGYRYYLKSYNYPSPHDPWDSHFDFGGDGDGTLFYPGRPDKIGGTNHIPIESIRLKALRMGLEDYEIFKYASDRGNASYVKTQIETAVGNGKYYYTSPQPSNTAMETARNNILSLFGGSSLPPGIATSSSSSTSAPSTLAPTVAPSQATTSLAAPSSSGDPMGSNKGVWEALLKQRSAPRNIFTNLQDPSLMAESNAFETSNEKISPGLLGLTAGDRTGREKLIQYVLGYDSSGRKRDSVLGPIVHSQPLVVPYGNSRSVIFVGANDGMLHAFDQATGEEFWGFIPYELLSRLKDLTNGNNLKYYVDGSPRAYVTQSQKVVVFGLRKGGNHYYALDVTDPGDPKLLWKIGPETPGYSEIGQTWSNPQIGKIKYGSGEKVVCFIGGGYDENQDTKTLTADDKRGRAVYAVDLLTGAQVWRWDGKRDPNMRYSIPSDISLADANSDGYVDRLYVGDMGGRLWRFDLVGSDPKTWSGKIAFDSSIGVLSGGRKIFYPPGITFEKGYEMVFFGTGDPEHLNGGTNLANQIYAFKDKGFKSTLSERDLANVTDGINNPESVEDKEGWFINLDPNKGEMLSAPPVVKSGVAYFTILTPSPDGKGGTASIYALNCQNGGRY